MPCLVVFLLLSFPLAAHAAAVRPLDAHAAEMLARAVRYSATVRALMRALDASNMIVHVESSQSLPAGIGGTTRFVSGRAGYRYLRITIDLDLSQQERVAILAHELQHACEVAASDVHDHHGMRRLFERLGHRHGEFYDTAAAVAMERHARRELRRGLEAEPVTKFHH